MITEGPGLEKINVEDDLNMYDIHLQIYRLFVKDSLSLDASIFSNKGRQGFSRSVATS